MWPAAEIPRTESVSLAEVAERVGSDSEAALRAFKKHVGIAPRQYRRQHLSLLMEEQPETV